MWKATSWFHPTELNVFVFPFWANPVKRGRTFGRAVADGGGRMNWGVEEVPAGDWMHSVSAESRAAFEEKAERVRCAKARESRGRRSRRRTMEGPEGTDGVVVVVVEEEDDDEEEVEEDEMKEEEEVAGSVC